MKKYPFSEFKVLSNVDRAFEVPFFMTKQTYNLLSKNDQTWTDCIEIAKEYGFNCIYVTDSVESKGRKVWEYKEFPKYSDNLSTSDIQALLKEAYKRTFK